MRPALFYTLHGRGVCVWGGTYFLSFWRLFLELDIPCHCSGKMHDFDSWVVPQGGKDVSRPVQRLGLRSAKNEERVCGPCIHGLVSTLGFVAKTSWFVLFVTRTLKGIPDYSIIEFEKFKVLDIVLSLSFPRIWSVAIVLPCLCSFLHLKCLSCLPLPVKIPLSQVPIHVPCQN